MIDRFAFAFVLLLFPAGVIRAADPASSSESTDEAEEIAAGHSFHGEAFNEGPRQAASLIDGMAEIDFPTSAKNETTQRFIEQGIAQLHGFWYLEAERSFRQAAKKEPDLAICYWGMALANTNNADRARGLIDEAMQRRNENTSRREKLYIEALDRYLPQSEKDDQDDKSAKKPDRNAKREAKRKRAERYLRDLEGILHEFPDDIEARAMLALKLWNFERAGIKMHSRYATNALLSEVFAVNPMHPAHHYRIHLWDAQRPQNALESAALCGPSSPGIAHMWHMPGHIYSKLKRYSDAAWQQEASARVDHAHMQRARLIPDQIHNYAHNNEWLTRNLLYIGRVDDALEQARNLVSLPRHPAYNTLSKRGSYKYGRQRLLQTLTEYGLWDELIKESGGHYLPPTEDTEQQEEWLSWLAVAHFMKGDTEQGEQTLNSLQRRRETLQPKAKDHTDPTDQTNQTGPTDQTSDEPSSDEPSSDEPSSDEPTSDEPTSDEPTADEPSPDEPSSGESPQEQKKHAERLDVLIARASAAAASQRGDKEAFEKQVKNAKLNRLIQAQWLADAGDLPAAIKLAERGVREGAQQVRPLAVLVDLRWRNDEKEEAKKQFQTLRKVAGEADLETPMLARLKPVAEAAGIEGDWRIATKPASDLGERPPLDQLGPFRWLPYTASSWAATNADGDLVASEELSGKPCILIFYLGFGCLHCVEQLHAFSPQIDEFREAGIDVVGISTESLEQLQLGIKNFDKKMNIELLSDGDHHVFESFRCWDDFENQPLHGTFLIDAGGRVRWQDIGHEPFNDADFVLEESKRLLALPD